MTLYLTYGMRKQAPLVLFPTLEPSMILDGMKTSPATVYCAVPPIYERTAMAAKEKGISLRSCKYRISGAMTSCGNRRSSIRNAPESRRRLSGSTITCSTTRARMDRSPP